LHEGFAEDRAVLASGEIPGKVESDRAGVEAMIEEFGVTEEEANELIVMVCTGFLDVGIGCGFIRECRLGDFYGHHPRDVCPHCSGWFVEDRKGKAPRPTARDHGWN
jgi:hypothetical protein